MTEQVQLSHFANDILNFYSRKLGVQETQKTSNTSNPLFGETYNRGYDPKIDNMDLDEFGFQQQINKTPTPTKTIINNEVDPYDFGNDWTEKEWQEASKRIERPANTYKDGIGDEGFNPHEFREGAPIDPNTKPQEINETEWKNNTFVKKQENLKKEIIQLEKEANEIEGSVNKAREDFIKANQEKLAKEAEYKSALEKCKSEGITLKKLEKEMAKNPTEGTIAEYMKALQSYNKSTKDLETAGKAYKDANTKLIGKLTNLKDKQLELKDIVKESETLENSIKQTEYRHGKSVEINKEIDKICNKEPLKPESILEKGEEVIGNKKFNWKKFGKRAALIGAALGAATLITGGILYLVSKNKDKAAVDPAAEEKTEGVEKTEEPAVTTDPLEENKKVDEEINRFKYDPNASFTVQKGDIPWNVVKQLLTNKNGKVPTDTEIVYAQRAIMKANGLEFVDEPGKKRHYYIKDWKEGLVVKQADFDDPNNRKLRIVGNHIE